MGKKKSERQLERCCSPYLLLSRGVLSAAKGAAWEHLERTSRKDVRDDA